MKHNNASFETEFNINDTFETYIDSNIVSFDPGLQEITAIYSSDHNKLKNRDLPNQHPISAITQLTEILNSKQNLLTAGVGIVLENDIISLGDFILDCGTSTTVI